MIKNLSYIILLVFSLSTQADTKTEGENSPIVKNTKGDVTIIYKSMGLSLQAHESLLRKEIEKTEKQLKKVADKKTKELIDRLSKLRKELDLVLDEKNRLAKMVYEYRQQIELLSKAKTKAKNKDINLVSDIEIIDTSEEKTKKLMAEIKNKQDKERLFSLLDILIADTESMEKDERQYWRDILPAMTFKQTYRLLEILVTERRKLVKLEEKYRDKIKALVKKGSMKRYEEQKKKIEKNGNIKEIELINIKKYVVYEPTINDLRVAERKTRELISLNPNYLDAYIFLVEVLNKYKEDRSYDIKILIENIQKKFKTSPELDKELGYAYVNLGKHKIAYDYIKRAATSDISDAKLLAMFASLSFDYGDTLFTQEILEKNYEKYKESSLFVAYYSHILDENGNDKKSKIILEEYLTFNKNTVRILNALAFKYYTEGNYKKALELFKRSHHKNKREVAAPVMAALSIIELEEDISEAYNLLEIAKQALDQKNKINKANVGEVYLALSIVSLEVQKMEKVVTLSNKAVKNTYGCSVDYMKKLNWHEKMLSLLKKHRLSIGCP